MLKDTKETEKGQPEVKGKPETLRERPSKEATSRKSGQQVDLLNTCGLTETTLQ